MKRELLVDLELVLNMAEDDAESWRKNGFCDEEEQEDYEDHIASLARLRDWLNFELLKEGLIGASRNA